MNKNNFAHGVVRVKFSGSYTSILARERAKYFAVLPNNVLAYSKDTGGGLLGESILAVLKPESDCVVIAATKYGSVIINFIDGMVKNEVLLNGEDGQLNLSLRGVLNDSPEGIVIYVSRELVGRLSSQLSQFETVVIEDGLLKTFSVSAKLARVKRVREQTPYPLYIGLAVILGGGLMWGTMRESHDVDQVEQDPYAQYKMEMQGNNISSAIISAVDVAKSTSTLITWKLKSIELSGGQVVSIFQPTAGIGSAKEFSIWAKDRGVNYHLRGNEIVSSSDISGRLMRLDSSKIVSDVSGLSYKIFDVLNSVTMFDSQFSPPVSKQLYKTIPLTITGDGVILDELVSLAKILEGWPLKVDRISLAATDREFVFNVVMTTTIIGE